MVERKSKAILTEYPRMVQARTKFDGKIVLLADMGEDRAWEDRYYGTHEVYIEDELTDILPIKEMVREFILLDSTGEEIDWIDPVVSVEETKSHWIVDNGYGLYEIEKLDRSYDLRIRYV